MNNTLDRLMEQDGYEDGTRSRRDILGNTSPWRNSDEDMESERFDINKEKNKLIPFQADFNLKLLLKIFLFGYQANSVFIIMVAFYLIAQTSSYGIVPLSFLSLGGFQFVSSILAAKFNESLAATVALIVSLSLSLFV